jgi:hypothetical protein
MYLSPVLTFFLYVAILRQTVWFAEGVYELCSGLSDEVYQNERSHVILNL